MPPFFAFSPPPTRDSGEVRQMTGSAENLIGMSVIMQPNGFKSGSASSSTQQYVYAKLDMNSREPSDAELEAAMNAYRSHPETMDEFKSRLFTLVSEDIDGLIP